MPPFQKGHKKVGGRKKGVPDRVTVRKLDELWRLLELKQADPFVELVRLMTSSDDARIRLQAAQALADRVLPRLKTVQLAVDAALQVEYRVLLDGDPLPVNGHVHGPGTHPERTHDDA